MGREESLGPTFDLVGDDLAKLYAAGRDKIIAFASKKIPNLADGKQANLRVSRDVLWNGAFSTEDFVPSILEVYWHPQEARMERTIVLFLSLMS